MKNIIYTALISFTVSIYGAQKEVIIHHGSTECTITGLKPPHTFTADDKGYPLINGCNIMMFDEEGPFIVDSFSSDKVTIASKDDTTITISWLEKQKCKQYSIHTQLITYLAEKKCLTPAKVPTRKNKSDESE